MLTSAAKLHSKAEVMRMSRTMDAGAAVHTATVKPMAKLARTRVKNNLSRQQRVPVINPAIKRIQILQVKMNQALCGQSNCWRRQ